MNRVFCSWSHFHNSFIWHALHSNGPTKKKLKATKENQIRLQETTKIIFPGEPGTSDLSKIKKLWNSKNLRRSEYLEKNY